MKRWERFSEEELKEIFYSSKTATEFANKIGYSNRSITRDIKKKYSWCDFKERDYNLIGQRFGRLVVIEYEGSINQSRRWLCKCDCGNIKYNVSTENLKSGNTKSCGCLAKEHSRSGLGKRKGGESIVGEKFGLLTVSPEIKYIDGIPKLKCICDCGNITYVQTNKLISGNTKSCGCLQKIKASNNKKFQKGDKIGELTIIEETEERKFRNIVYKCQCSCGNICYRTAQSIKENSSCGCKNTTKSTVFLQELFKKMNIKYEQEYSFPDLIGTNKVLRFDFAIFENDTLKCLIEYQGRQHYEPVDFWGGEEGYIQQQIYDNKKREYCHKNNIPLIEICYKDKNKIDSNYILDKIGGYINA